MACPWEARSFTLLDIRLPHRLPALAHPALVAEHLDWSSSIVAEFQAYLPPRYRARGKAFLSFVNSLTLLVSWER
eukprot:7276711-Pyramimonas_sp.AAC.1